MIGSTVVNTHTGFDNVNLFEQEDLYKAVAAAETGDEESKRLIVSLMDSLCANGAHRKDSVVLRCECGSDGRHYR